MTDPRRNNRLPVQNRPMAVRRTEPEKKKSGCGGAGAALFLVAIFGLAILMISGVIPTPFEEKITLPPPTQQFTSTPFVFGTIPVIVSEEPTTLTSSPTPSLPTDTPVVLPSDTPAQTPTNPSMPFVLRGAPEGYPNALIHPQYDCEEFLFIGGEVWDLREAPVIGLKVKLTGTYGGAVVDFTSESGDIDLYGESGFEFVMDNQQISADTMYIQLFDENDQPLSAPVQLSITGQCDSNLIIVNYKQVQEIPD